MRSRGDTYASAGVRPAVSPVRARVAAELGWARQRLGEARDRRYMIPSLETPTQTPDRYRDVRVIKNVTVPMRDGVILAADVYSPAGAGRLPAVLIRMPYGKDRHYAMATRGKFWGRKGYHCVIQDVRGRGRSGGEWGFLENEAADGYDTLDWLAAQPWCDGNIGMAGESYYGMTQWAVAPLGHPNLRCIAPGHTACDLYDVVHPGGAFTHTTLGLWAYIMRTRRDRNPYRFDPWHLPLISSDEDAGGPSRPYKDYVEHWARDSWWEQRRLSRRHAEVTIPVLEWGGWFDLLLPGTLADWGSLMSPATGPELRSRRWLMIGPTDHAFTTLQTSRAGRLSLGGCWWPFDRVKRFFDLWLRGERNGAGTDSRVQLYSVGRDRWHGETEWPPPSAQPTRYYLHSGGRANTAGGDGALDLDPPGEEREDILLYDPEDPVCYWFTRDLWESARHLGDRREVEGRRDVLVYTSSPLERPLEVCGPIRVSLHVASSRPDTDFTAALVDVYPDGYAQLVQEGIMRARFREGCEHEVLLEPERVTRMEIDLAAASHAFACGHQVRLEVSSSSFGRWDRNLNTADRLGRGVAPATAVNRIRHDRQAPSYLVLPVVDGD